MLTSICSNSYSKIKSLFLPKQKANGVDEKVYQSKTQNSFTLENVIVIFKKI